MTGNKESRKTNGRNAVKKAIWHAIAGTEHATGWLKEPPYSLWYVTYSNSLPCFLARPEQSVTEEFLEMNLLQDKTNNYEIILLTETYPFYIDSHIFAA